MYSHWAFINKTCQDESKHYMSQDHILHVQMEIYDVEISGGQTRYDLRQMYRHTLKISELLNAAVNLLPRLRHVEIQSNTKYWEGLRRIHLDTTYEDGRIWIGKHNLPFASLHAFYCTYISIVFLLNLRRPD